MVVLFGAEKGGVGKSTLAVNMAAMRAARDIDVLLVDADVQGSAQRWIELRGKQDPVVTCVALYGRTLADQIRELKRKYTDIIIDTRGSDSYELRAAMLVADLLVTPVMPSVFDYFSLAKMDRLAGEVKELNTQLRAVVVINGAPTNVKQTDAADLRESMTELEHYTVLMTVVKFRKAYKTSVLAGQAVVENLGNGEKAVMEMMELYSEIFMGEV